MVTLRDVAAHAGGAATIDVAAILPPFTPRGRPMKATVARALLALLAVAVLAGCGLKGPLYQPPPETPKPAKPAKPAG